MALQGVLTDGRKQVYAGLDLTGSATGLDITNFELGEGGWQILLGNRVPKTPDPTRTDLEANTQPSEFLYNKAFGIGEVVVLGETTTVTISLAANEVGLDGNGLLDGTNPHMYELGLFDSNGDLVVYCTFDEIVKVAGTPITIVLTLDRNP